MHLTKFLLFASSVAALPSKKISLDYHDYGELRVAVIAKYNWIWDDTGSGAKRSVGILHPKQENAFRPLGSIVTDSHGNTANDKRATLIAALNPDQPPANASKPALKEPVGWTKIWDDAGSGSKKDGSFWRPQCPTDYVSLGDVGSGAGQPTHPVWCLRRDLAMLGNYKSASFWDDKSSGAKKDISLWEVIPVSTGIDGAESIPLYTGTFRAVGSHGTPHITPWVLSIRIPKQVTQFASRVPNITENAVPNRGQLYSEVEQAKVVLPLTAFYGPTDDKIIKNLHAPFCKVSRSVAWLVEGIWENGTDGSVTRTDDVAYGVSKEQTESMEHTTGISLSASSGIGLVSYEVSLNYQFTYSTSSSFSEYSSYTKKEEFTIPPHYMTIMFCKLMRTKVTLDGGAVMFESDSLASGEFHLSGTKLSQARIAALNTQQ